MPVFAFSEAAIAQFMPPKSGRTDYWDRNQPGFGLRLTHTGHRTWQIMYRAHGRRRRMALGEWPALSLKHARLAAAQALKTLADGGDPARQRVAMTGGPVTFEHLAHSYIERYAKRHKKSWAADAGMINRTLIPAWGSRAASTIARRDVIELIEIIAVRGHPYAANRTLALVRKMFAWAQQADLVLSSPAVGVPAPARETGRTRFLSEKEIADLWSAWGQQGWPYGILFKLLLLTGQPRSDIAGMRLEDIRIQSAIWMPLQARTHEGHTHELPLSEFSLEILSALPRSASPLVFPARPGSETPVSGFSHAVGKSRQLSGVAGWQLRDLRRTAAVGMVRAGASPELLDGILNVRAGAARGVRGIYQLAAAMEDKRRIVNAWAEQVRVLTGTR